MSDIDLIKNLRDLAALAHADVSVADEAADEIARLRVELAARAAPCHIDGCQYDALDRLNAENARLREALKDARNNGLIYWEPRTERGHVSKAQMLSRIDAALAEEEAKP